VLQMLAHLKKKFIFTSYDGNGKGDDWFTVR